MSTEICTSCGSVIWKPSTVTVTPPSGMSLAVTTEEVLPVHTEEPVVSSNSLMEKVELTIEQRIKMIEDYIADKETNWRKEVENAVKNEVAAILSKLKTFMPKLPW